MDKTAKALRVESEISALAGVTPDSDINIRTEMVVIAVVLALEVVVPAFRAISV